MSVNSEAVNFEVITKWTTDDVARWMRTKKHNEVYVKALCQDQQIDGKSLLLLTESDLKQSSVQFRVLGDLKRLYFDILEIQQSVSANNLSYAGATSFWHSTPLYYFPSSTAPLDHDSFSAGPSLSGNVSHMQRQFRRKKRRVTFVDSTDSQLSDEVTDADSSPGPAPGKENSHQHHHCHHTHQGYATVLEPEAWKALVAMGYVFIVTWITALVMVIVHDRVPDMEKYPPLPDLFLDNMPHIPWAFEMCEVTGTVLFCIWIGVLFFHKHRFILIRRFFALSGTVFLLRCVTMLITSLSVPGTHLQCNPRPYGDWVSRLYNAYLIWKGAGMSIQGVRTCGDYMFSGHTVALTMLNFFVTEYTTRRLYYIHTLSWLLNMFGIFFILAAHEHYSIDVFIAFYITSRLFLYYHTLANNQALMQRDSKRTKVWFPLFSYFESGVDGIVPNQYEWPITPKRLKSWTLNFLKTLETKWKDTVSHPTEGLLHRTNLFNPNSKPKTS
ncbi:unnamed protein product [Allacma fusca]|uniref:SAM domain-containing protein n=1 Tax=Allacma fusca TaxID=39272 RepID=A0A8J2M879_9HEXA|nr:unnamed protein product [Allacma fusca]